MPRVYAHARGLNTLISRDWLATYTVPLPCESSARLASLSHASQLIWEQLFSSHTSSDLRTTCAGADVPRNVAPHPLHTHTHTHLNS